MDKIIPNNVKKLRGELRLTLQDIAERGGISKSTVHYIENGFREPKQETIVLISKGMGMPAEVVFCLNADDPVFIEYMRNKQQSFTRENNA
jgi:transcriptional regulator with XRE-family HTH domain